MKTFTFWKNFNFWKKLGIFIAFMFITSISGWAQVTSFPYTEGWEGGSFGSWTQATYDNDDWSNNTGSTGSTGTGPSSANEGSNYIYCETSGSSNGDIFALESPTFDFTSLSSPYIVFDYHMLFDGESDGTLNLDVSTNGGSSWTTAWTKTGEQGSSWQIAYVDLSSYTSSNNVQLRFHFTTGTSGSTFDYDAAIDYVQILSITCFPPTNLTASALETTADISWTTGGAANANLEYGPTGFTLGSGTYVSDVSNPYTISGLSATTSYDVYVQDSCSSTDVSTWTGPLTFTTSAPLQSMPFNDGFESTLNAWSFSGSVTPATTTDQAYEGSQSLELIGENTQGDALATIRFNASTGSPRLSFAYYIDYYYYSEFSVEIQEAGSSSWTMIHEFTGGYNDDATWIYKELDLGTYNTTSGPFKIRLNAENTSSYGDQIYVDAFNLIDITCPPPSGLTVSSITSNSAAIDWTSGGSTTWNIEYGPSGYTPGTGTFVSNITTKPYTISGLSMATYYDIYIQDSCSVGDVSPWTGPETFFTPLSLSCGSGIQDTIYREDWESGQGQWTGDIGTSNGEWQINSGSTGSSNTGPDGAHDGSYYIYYEASSSGIASMVSPPIDLSSGTGSAYLSYYMHAYGSDFANSDFSIGVSTSPTGPFYLELDTTFTGQAQNGHSDPYIQQVLDLTSYLGQTIYLEFTFDPSSTYEADLALDQMEVHTCVSCPAPSGLTVSNIQNTSADIDWTSSASQWLVEYGPSGFTQGTGDTMIVNSKPATLSGLNQATIYDVYVKDICSVGDTSAATGPITFITTTAPLCGSYTIGDTTGGASYDFPSFNRARDFLTIGGISCPVTFNVASGTYTEQVSFDSIPGASATNTVTFQANSGDSTDVVLQYASTGTSDLHTVLLNNVDYLIFNQMTIKGNATNYGRVITMENLPQNITIQNCIIEAPIYSSSYSCPIYSINNPVHNLTIQNNHIIGGYYGTYMDGESSDHMTGLVIENNFIEDYYYYGAYFYYQDGMQFNNNKLRNSSSSGSVYGMRAYYADNTTITNNDIAIAGTGTHYGIYLRGDGTSTNPNLIANNVINLTGTGSSTWYGMYIYYNDYSNIYHNTVNLTAGSSTARALYTTSGSDINIENNIFTNAGGGYAAYIYTTSAINTMDYNVYNTTGSNIAYWSGAKATLADLQSANSMDANSTEDDPVYANVIHNDLTPLYDGIDDMGTPISSITSDIFGNARSATTPDVGAIEFTGVSSDLALTDAVLINGECLSSNDSIYITIDNVIVSSVDFSVNPLTVVWTSTGPVNSNGTFTINTGTLAAAASDMFGGDGVDMSVPGDYTLSAYIQSNAANPFAGNDTLNNHSTNTVINPFAATPQHTTIMNNGIDTVELSVQSPYFPGGDVFLTEICQYASSWASGGPTTIPGYLGNDYVELTGAPGSDLSGYTFEKWDNTGSSPEVTHTFPAGTSFSPNGTYLLSTVGGSTSISDYHQKANTTSGYSSSSNSVNILKDPSGTIIDVVLYETSSTIPAAAGISSSDWSGPGIDGSSSWGIRLEGADTDDNTNWVKADDSPAVQDPNVANSGVTVPSAVTITGFTWTHSASTISTNVNHTVGPYTTEGTYEYIATYNSSQCGTVVDTAIVEVVDPKIDTFPYVETFEVDPNVGALGWYSYTTGSYHWQMGTNTPSSGTGAEQDHTTGNGYFIYTEASSGSLNDSTMAVTPELDFSTLTSPKMNFWYHMHGSDMGKLYIDAYIGSNWISAIDSIIGEQQANQADPWMMKTVDLGMYATADSVRFTAVRGDGLSGDISVDDVAFGTDLNVDLGPDTAICADATITFDAGYQPTWTYQWYFNSMTNPAGTGQTLTANTTGKYYVVVTDAAYFTAIDSVNLTVNPLPVVDFPALPDVCENSNTVTLDMATPSGGTYSGTGVSGTIFDPDVAGFGSYMLYYTYTDGNGCTNIDSSQITVKPIPSLATTPLQDVCIDATPFTLSFATPTGGTYYGPGVYNGMFYPDSAGTGTHYIKYTYTATNGCSNVDSVPVTVNPLPVISATAGTNPVSYGTSTVLDVTINGSSSYTYTWTPADSLANPTDANLKNPQTKNLTRPTQFDVVVTDAVTSCSNTDNIALGITGGPLSVTPISYRDTICKDDTTRLFAQASGGSETYTYSWSSSPAGFNSTDANPIVTVNGTITYTVTVNDGFNVATGSVTVENYSAPVISLSSANGPTYLECALSDTLSATPAGGTFAGNGITGNIFSPASAGIGTHYIQYLYTDVHGCLTIDTLMLTVAEDVTPPAVVTQDMDVYLDAGGSVSISASDIDNGTTDNCGVQSLSLNQNVFSCAHTGTNTVTLTAEDINGNISTGTATVTVYDTISPTVITQNVTGYLDANGVVTVKPSEINNGSSDNCAIMMVTLSKTNYYCSNIGPNNVSLNVTDASGNSATGTAVVTILDTVSPNVITQNVTAYLDASGQASIAVADVDNGSTDNCGINNMSLDKTSFSCSDVGTNTVTLTVNDIYGNTAYASATVTVADTSAPTVVTQNVSVYLDASGNAGINTGDIHLSSSDNCGVASIALSKSSFTCSDLGINNIILSVTDVNGNITSKQATVTVMDTITPVAVAQNHTVYLDTNGNATIVPADVDNGSSDNCSINLSLDVSSFDCNDVGSPQTVTLTATDQAGNSHSATAQITVMDTISPTVILQNITAYLDGSGQVTISASDVDNGTRDNCGVNTLSLDNTSFSCSDIGANTVTLTATDINGNTASGTATVTVMDTMAPNVITQNMTVYLDAAGQASITTSDINNGSSDNCGIASMSLDKTAFDCNNPGTNTVNLTVTDVNSNQASATAIVTVVDTIAPNVIAQNITVYLDTAGQATVVPADVDNGSTDNCSLSLSVNPSTFNCTHIGTPQTVTLTGTDGNGNTASANATVTVMDTISPMLLTKNATVYLDLTGQAAITLADIDDGSYDNCGINNHTLSKTTFYCDDAGVNTITYTATDVNGNSTTANVQITVLDTIKPQAIAQNVTVYLNSTGQASVAVFNIDNGSYDNCALNYVLSKSYFDCADVGVNNVTLTVTDPGGNSDMATATVTVLDTITPQVNTQNITAYLDASGQATITPADVDNSSVINCPVNYSLSQSAFDCNDIGINTVTLYATDNTGNTDSATAQVTVADTISPVVNSQNIVVYLDAAGQAAITAADVDNGSFDNCNINTVSAGTTSFDCSNVGPNTVTLTVTDNSGNIATGNAQVMVMDTINPVAMTQSITVYLDSTGNASISTADIDNGSSDNCSIDTLYLDKYAFTCSDAGMNTVTLTVADVNGNTATKTAQVNVLDNINPNAVAQSMTVYLDANGQATITPADIDNGSWDNCQFNLTISQNTFDCSDVGNNSINLTATDASGNTDVATANVNIVDSTAPVVMTQNIDIYLNSNGQATISVADIDNGTSDNCGLNTTSLSKTVFDCNDIGINTVTLTASDVYGNTSTGTAQVTVIDSSGPVIFANNISVFLDSTGQASINVNDINNGTWDNCGIDSLYLSHYNFDCSNLGFNTITMHAKDINGNISTAPAIVNVYDTINPTAIAQDITVSLDATGNAGITASDIDNGSYDNCGILFTSIDKTSFNCSDVGTNMVMLTVTDNNLNTSMALAQVTVVDNIAPVVIAQNATIYLDASGQATLSINDVNNSTTDNCGIASIVLSQTNFDCNDVGTNTVTITATDVNGNTTNDNVDITVVDNTSPVVLSNNITVYLDAAGQASITAADIDNISYDNCSISSMSVDITNFDCSDLGSNTVNLTVSDPNGNSSSTNAVVTVVDTIQPVAQANNITVSLDASGQAVITETDIDDGSYDNCGINSMTLDTTTFDCSDIGTNPVILTVIDNDGNSSTATATVTVEDNLAPVVMTNDITAYLDASGQVSITASDVDNGSMDNCNINSLYLNTNNFTCSDLGMNTVVLTAEDMSGNSATAIATVTVEDTIKPVLLANNLTVYLDASGQASVSTTDIDNGSTDNCTLNNLALDQYTFSCQDLGVNSITLTGTDQSNNTSQINATVTVVDTIYPVMQASNITVYLDAYGYAMITPADVDNGSYDNCGIDNMTLDVFSFNCSDMGANTVTLSGSDFSGNTVSTTATVTVIDNNAPMVLTKSSAVFLDSSGNASITVSDVDNGSWDNCSITNMSLDINTFNCYNLGPNNVTLTATDINGNTATGTATISVIDTISPTVQTSNITVQLNAGGQAVITPFNIDNGTFDNCNINNLMLDINTFDCNDIGTNTVNLMAWDGSGNYGSATAQVTVEDNTPPVISTIDIPVFLDNTGQAIITANDLNNGTYDNCMVDTMMLSKYNFTCNDLGQNLVTFTAQDVNGNSSTSAAVVTVYDNIAPNVITQNITVYLDAFGLANITASDIDNGSTDNCSVMSMNLDNTVFACSDVGTNTVTLTVNDVNNNSATATAQVTVMDTIAPNAVTQNYSVYLDNSGQASITTNNIDNGSSDNCGIVSRSLDISNFTCSDLGNNLVVLTVSDQAGNVSSSTSLVNVIDTITPTITQINDTTICAGIFNYNTPAAYDNCNVTVNKTYGPASGDILIGGSYTITFVASDDAGNTATSSFNVTVSEPYVDLGPDMTICHDDSLELSADPGFTAYLWSTGETTSSIKVDSASLGLGSHKLWVTVTDSIGCTSTDTIIVEITNCVGIEDFTDEGTITIYPNPNNGIFNLEIQGLSENNIEVCIYNFNGQKIVCERLHENFKDGFRTKYDLSAYPKGVYLIRLSGNHTQKVKRVIIQ